MTRPIIKVKRYTVSLNQAEDNLLRTLMEEARKVQGEESNFFASLLVAREDCKQNHGKSKVGRPKNEDSDDTPPPFVLPQEDTLSFTPEELKALAKKNKKA